MAKKKMTYLFVHLYVQPIRHLVVLKKKESTHYTNCVIFLWV